MKEYENVDTREYEIDMIEYANKVTSVKITYNNVSVAEEVVLSTPTNIVDLSGDEVSGTFVIRHAQNPQNVNGGSILNTYDVSLNTSLNILVNIPHAFMDSGTYTLQLPLFNSVTTCIYGSHYIVENGIPKIQVRKYSSLPHASFDYFTIADEAFKSVAFKFNKVEEALITIPEPTFSDDTAFNFQTSLANVASNLTNVDWTTLANDSIANETYMLNAADQVLEYSLVSLDRVGRGNMLEILSPNAEKPIKTLLIETPDVSRILSGDGAPSFRLHANGHVEAHKVSAYDRTDTASSILNEYVSYSVLDTSDLKISIDNNTNAIASNISSIADQQTKIHAMLNGKTIFIDNMGLESIIDISGALDSNTSFVNVNGDVTPLANIASIHVGRNVTSIGDAALNEATALTNVTFEPFSNVVSIGAQAFRFTALPKIVIPNSVQSIGNQAFMGSSLTEITFEPISTLNSIGIEAFATSSLKNIAIPASVQNIGDRAFANLTTFTSVSFEGNSQLALIGESAFSATALTSVTIPKSVTALPYMAFGDCTNLTQVDFEYESTLHTIANSAFTRTGLTSIIIPHSVKTMDIYAFYQNQNLSKVEFGLDSLLETIGNDAFKNCSSLREIYIPEAVTSIGSESFANCTALQKAEFGPMSALSGIGFKAFHSSAINEVTIPSSVQSIAQNAFGECSNLSLVKFQENSTLTTLNQYTFFGSNALAKMRLPSSIANIDPSNNWFVGVSNLHLTMKSGGVTELVTDAFNGSDFKAITIPASVSN